MWVYDNSTEAGTFSSGRGRNKNIITRNSIGDGVLDVDPVFDCQSGDTYIGVVPNSPSATTV